MTRYRNSVGHLAWISFCVLISTGFGWRMERLDNIERGQHGCAGCCWNYRNHCGCIWSIIGHWLHNQVEVLTWWDKRDNCIDGELSLEHSSSMSPRYAKYEWGDGLVGTVGWAGWGKKGRAGGGLRMAWGEILCYFWIQVRVGILGKSVQTHVPTAYCTYECYWSFSWLCFWVTWNLQGINTYMYIRGKVRNPTCDMKCLAWIWKMTVGKLWMMVKACSC